DGSAGEGAAVAGDGFDSHLSAPVPEQQKRPDAEQNAGREEILGDGQDQCALCADRDQQGAAWTEARDRGSIKTTKLGRKSSEHVGGLSVAAGRKYPQAHSH